MAGERADADAQDQAAAAAASRQRHRNQVIAVTPDGPQNVTEHVVTLLDAVTGSLDWGSGFLNREDLMAWKTLAELLAFDAEPIREADQLLQQLARKEREQAAWKARHGAS